MPKFAPGAVALAKEKGLHLLTLEIVGKHAKKGGMSFSGPIGPETAKKVWELIVRICDVNERMK